MTDAALMTPTIEENECPFVPPLEKTKVEKKKRVPKSEKKKVERAVSNYQKHLQGFFAAHKGTMPPRDLFKAAVADWHRIQAHSE